VDEETPQFYRSNAQAYAEWAKRPSLRLIGFLALLPRGGSILELGCAAAIIRRRCWLRASPCVRPTVHRNWLTSLRVGRPVEAMLFDEREAYDGAWASASLLHVPRDELAGILLRVHREH